MRFRSRHTISCSPSCVCKLWCLYMVAWDAWVAAAVTAAVAGMLSIRLQTFGKHLRKRPTCDCDIAEQKHLLCLAAAGVRNAWASSKEEQCRVVPSVRAALCSISQPISKMFVQHQAPNDTQDREVAPLLIRWTRGTLGCSCAVCHGA
jgi:hypothetical protein